MNYNNLKLEDIKKELCRIVDQHEVMKQFVDLPTVRKELKEAIEWFLDPVESEERKDES
tara:strand:+ start:314 stop:490 length:177 start_codon:yes stop_codon:yes gene_type:complete